MLRCFYLSIRLFVSRSSRLSTHLSILWSPIYIVISCQCGAACAAMRVLKYYDLSLKASKQMEEYIYIFLQYTCRITYLLVRLSIGMFVDPLSLYLSVCLLICPSAYLRIHLNVWLYLTISFSVYLSICLFSYLSVCLFVNQSLYRSIFLSTYLPIYLSIYLSMFLSI